MARKKSGVQDLADTMIKQHGLEGTETPWFYSNERNFFDPKDTDGIEKATVVRATESKHYTAPTN